MALRGSGATLDDTDSNDDNDLTPAGSGRPLVNDGTPQAAGAHLMTLTQTMTMTWPLQTAGVTTRPLANDGTTHAAGPLHTQKVVMA